MSADVQPRKRKDKKKKRDSLDSKSEVEITVGKISLKDDEEIHHGVHATKMGADDVHLHIQADHSTGGHWCAKVFFFSLLAILLGLIGLIINENRGLSDLDTPLSESRFSEYFEGWVDEHRQAHDDHHDKIPSVLEDHDAEPFEEEEDHSEIDEDEHDDHEAHDEHEEHDDHEEEADATEDVDENEKDPNEEIAEEEENQEVANDDEDDDENDEGDEDEAPPSEEYSYTRSKRDINEEPEDDEDEGFGDSEEAVEPNDDDDEEDGNNEENTPPSTEVPSLNQEDDPYDEDDDDFESLENVVDNDADEQLHLEQKAKQEKEQSPSYVAIEEEEPQSSSKIKPRQGGGPQSYTEDELIEEELRRANEDMLQNNLQSALRIFESLSLKYPDVPGALYGKAKALDRLSEEVKSNQILMESILAYKRFLALDEKIDDALYLEATERCIDRMRFRGLHLQAVTIHHSLIKRFPQDPRHRNELSITYLLINRSEGCSERNFTSMAK